ncbi:MAG: hypothetical protein BIFFINMI_03559 [Phycisphaerae bacterium]|nr:hypothetical protein [Phycisphaerae bacterium]
MADLPVQNENLPSPSRPPGRPDRGLIAVAVLLVVGVGVVLVMRSRGGPIRSELPWSTDSKTALAEAGRKNLPVLMIFSQVDCPPCIQLKRDVLESKPFENVARGRVVLADLDVNADPANRELFFSYGGEGTPFAVLTDATGRKVAQWDYRTPFADWLDERLGAGGVPTTTQPALIQPSSRYAAAFDGRR